MLKLIQWSLHKKATLMAAAFLAFGLLLVSGSKLHAYTVATGKLDGGSDNATLQKVFTGHADLTTATGFTEMSLTLKNVGNNNDATGVSWSGVTLAGGANATTWKASDQYLLVSSTLSARSTGIQIFTDNTDAMSSVGTLLGLNKFSGSTTGGNAINPAGLVAVSDTAAKPLPMAWRVAPISTTTLSIAEGVPGTNTCNGVALNTLAGVNPATLLYITNANWSEPWCFPAMHYFTDVKTPNSGFSPSPTSAGGIATNNYSVIRDAERGIQQAELDYLSSDGMDYVYFFANFKNAVNTQYNARIVVEAYTE